MIIRKLGKIVRGKATPFQIFMACLLGTLIAFVPNYWRALGLSLSLLGLLVILNANLGLAALTGILSRLIFVAITPISFSVGRFLLEGPTEGLFRKMVNSPVLAFFEWRSKMMVARAHGLPAAARRKSAMCRCWILMCCASWTADFSKTRRHQPTRSLRARARVVQCGR